MSRNGSLLTLTETSIARLVAAGRTNQEVAALLSMQPIDVEAHLEHVYRKLGIHSRSELALLLATEKQEP